MVEDKDRVLQARDAGEWFRDNVENIILIIICSVYVLRGFAMIETSGKTITEIIADGAVAFAGGYLIKILLGKKGIIRGLKHNKFVATTNAYGDKKLQIADCVEELEPFCNYVNQQRLAQKQKEFLLKHGMSYNLFINHEYDDDDQKRDIVDQCRKIAIFKYTPVLLTNAYDNAANEQELLTATIKRYEKKQRFGDAALGVIVFLLFGYFTMRPGGDINDVLWSALQVALFLANGSIKYLSAFFFVTETLRGKIKRVIDIIDQFINIRTKNKDIFAIKKSCAD